MLKKAFLTNSSGILCSRVFGFLRDLSMANILGAGVYSDIFFVAFKFPNLFRRIFGEGAFTQSFLPSFIASSKKGAFSVLVLLLFSCALIGFSLLVVAFSGAFTKVLALGFDDELIKLASPIVAIHFWYLFLVFLVTFFSTLLQYKQHFWVSAYNTALLNIAMICALLFARGSDELQIVYIASYGVLAGGVAQIALHIYPLHRLGFVRLFVCGVGELRVAFFKRDSKGDSVLGEQGRVGFLAKNGDCCGEPAVITAQGNSLDSPCKAPFLAQKSCREQTSLESTFAQSSHSTTATPRILEEDNQTECEKSAENQKQPQSKKVDSSVKLDSSPNAPFSVIASRDSGVAIYTKNTHSLESTFENNANKTHKVDSSDAPIFAGAEAVDCHDFACAKSRNDNRKNTIDEKVDSSNAQSVFSQNAVRRQDLENLESTFDNTTILKQFAKDSRICDEKSGLSSDWQGSYLSGDLRQSCRIADLSRKTSEAVQGEAAAGFFSKAQSTSKKPTPKAAKLASTIKTELRAFFKQFLPAMLGSSTAQIASFIDTILASFLASGAISYLYYANRIFQLPLAIFAIAISTALFPMVAKAIKANEHQKALIAMKKAFWFLLFMLLFCAVGGIVLREQIIWLLYEHGKFSRADTLECAMVFGAYMVGLVPFGCARIFSLYLYSRSQQALAAKISAISLFVGVVFSLVLMQFWGAFGLALAGSLSGFVLFALTIRAFGFGEFWAIICARNYALLLGFMLVCEVLLLALWLHYIQIPH